MKYRYLTLEELKEIHRKIIEETGGTYGILSPSNLENCIEAPKTGISGLNHYKSVIEKAAILLYNVVKLHPFLDGNKRTAFVATAVFLDLNGYDIDVKLEDSISFFLDLARCSLNYYDTIEWLRRYAKEK